MKSNEDSTKQLRWFAPDVFHRTLYEVDVGHTFNKRLASMVYVDGGIRTTVKTQSDMDYELRIRAMCKDMEPQMREAIAKWVAKKLT